jgi:hypothetical protein
VEVVYPGDAYLPLACFEDKFVGLKVTQLRQLVDHRWWFRLDQSRLGFAHIWHEEGEAPHLARPFHHDRLCHSAVYFGILEWRGSNKHKYLNRGSSHDNCLH